MEITGIMVTSAKLINIKKEAEDTYTYKFDIPAGTSWDAGTNAHLVANGTPNDFTPSQEHTRHLSISSLPHEGYMGFTTRVREGSSTFKRNLKVCQIGDQLQIYGLKNRLPLSRKNKPVVLISMGVGMATMRPMILEYAKNQDQIDRLISINIDKEKTMIYKNELEYLKIPRFYNHYVSQREELYAKINRTFQFSDAEYHIVGSDDFLNSIASFLIKNNIDLKNIKLDKKTAREKQILTELASL